MKNIDTIRSLTAEELSKLLDAMISNGCNKGCPAFKFCNDNYLNTPCHKVLYDWFVSDVEVNQDPKKIFISMPMYGKTESNIKATRNKIINACYVKYGRNIKIIDSVLDETTVKNNKPLFCLGKSIELLADADIAVFDIGWKTARGCKIEHECCERYGIKPEYYINTENCSTSQVVMIKDFILAESEKIDAGNGNVFKVDNGEVYLNCVGVSWRIC